MEPGIPLGRVAGIPLSVHWSVLVILWLFGWSLADSLPATAPGHSTGIYWLAGLSGAVVLILSVFAHELTHAFVARRYGVEVHGIQMWLFGGIAQLESEAKDARAEFRIAASGPVTSLILAGLFAAVATALRGVAGADIVTAVIWWLAAINVVVGLFNLLPGAPLDGGRILRAYLWKRHGDAERAATQSLRAGRVLAYMLIGVGLFEFLRGITVGGVWLVFIGWFLLSAARTEQMTRWTRRALAGLAVADVMTAHPHTAPGWISVDEFIQRYLLGDRHSAYPVEDRNGDITGLITLRQLRNIAPELRVSTLVSEAAIPRDRVPETNIHESITDLLGRLDPACGSRALVVDAGRVVGIVTAEDILRLVDVRALAVQA
ncbi:site-2 protease family protein [Mycolicibacterium aubagnense]|uniref:Zinc metalloprotease n=1 Tax=Mycolicibacterium aubagnense TaxID=319707 RepID=A0ABM9SD17_9MYCO|nr:site-2 protease family protein [Mycolicibacterium aubagnense]TLH48536.1 site-2 protease family protein [Mycolicibacterium aubagnense]WGI35082.1 site-2 protease family protein [Mycolicibacterium aubagnense]BBX82979.1 putative zinc metalloprotease Rip3 [Mycolicibacterium aubagnense]